MAPRPKKSPKSSNEDLMLGWLESVGDKIDNVAQNVNSLDKKLDLHIQETVHRFESIAKLDQEQNKLLEEHHDRSVQLKRDNDLREEQLRAEIMPRLEKLEVPQKFLEATKSVLLWIAAALGVVVAVKEVMNLFQ